MTQEIEITGHLLKNWTCIKTFYSLLCADEDSFAPEAAALLESMVQNQLLQAQILTHEEDGVPYIQLYKIQADKVTKNSLSKPVVQQNSSICHV